jgi:hypothetical protein
MGHQTSLPLPLAAQAVLPALCNVEHLADPHCLLYAAACLCLLLLPLPLPPARQPLPAGVMTMKIGERCKLTCPPELAYGA